MRYLQEIVYFYENADLNTEQPGCHGLLNRHTKIITQSIVLIILFQLTFLIKFVLALKTYLIKEIEIKFLIQAQMNI